MLKAILFTLIILSGCIKTVVPKAKTFPPTSEELTKTEETAQLAVGYQYLLIFPFGRVYLEAPELALKEAIKTELIIERSKLQNLVFKANNISLNAYDLFFTRKISCSVKGEFSLDNRTIPIEANFSSYSKFGFIEELSANWQRCSKEVAKEILTASTLVTKVSFP